jgi:uroporphyrinogen-III decarboxylase
MHRILEINARAVTTYLNAQIDAGAQAVMVFDSWGGVLADGAFQRFSLDYTRRVVQGLQREKEGQRIPVIVFTKGGGPWLEEIAACGADVVGLDWTVNLSKARAAVGGQVALQGNLDPNVLFAPPEAISREAVAVLDAPTGAGTAISSTLATASASTRRPNMCRRFVRPCTAIRGAFACPPDTIWPYSLRATRAAARPVACCL